jgi:cell division protein FtsI (penicillin-binding protein 3)
MMETVLDPEEGTARPGPVPGYRVAGKTGTAQIPSATAAATSTCQHNSFVGFAPAESPRFTVYVVVKGVHGGAGGLTAARRSSGS